MFDTRRSTQSPRQSVPERALFPPSQLAKLEASYQKPSTLGLIGCDGPLAVLSGTARKTGMAFRRGVNRILSMKILYTNAYKKVLDSSAREHRAER